MEKSSSIKEIINNSLEQIRTIIDADTVVGRQIVTASGTVIIPISKVSMGFASGGLDMPNDECNFGGGGGTGVTVNPIGFLVVYGDGRVEMLPLVQEKAGPIEQIADILDHTPDIINRIKSAFSNKEADELTEEVAELEAEYARRLQADAESKKSKKEKKKDKKRSAYED